MTCAAGRRVTCGPNDEHEKRGNMGNVKKDISTGNLLEALQSTLAAMPASDFLEATKDLLEVLGYQSGRTQKLPGSADDFIREFPAPNQNTRTEQEFREHIQSVQLIFQVTSDEIAASSQPTFDFDAASFDRGQQQSFIFFAVELKKATCARGQYAQFTREINKRLSQPTVVLFKTTDLPAEHGSAQAGNLLTAAFVHRREHKRAPERDVLGKVSLIREIDPANPHRAHLDIFAELSLAECARWMDLHSKPHNFDGLLASWLDKLDTEELNRRFYGELFDWFEWAVEDARFPSIVPKKQQVIRLITRILFVWFIKEKGLVREEWFVKAEMEQLLRNFGGSDYYRAVLQNLFFATLNTEIGARGFSTRKEPSHRVFSRYRYQSLINDVKRFEDLMKQTPFINGGLFDCLDDEESRSDGGKRIDMFSDPDPNEGPRAAQARRDAWQELDVPDALFFDDEDGLFPLLNHYKFTVEENTPIEQEVALDPELLGKVFENLLAAYNPETRDTVQKQTGSYYTPRAVVDFMVDEALVETLKQKCLPKNGNADDWDTSLRWLLDYADEFNDVDVLFDKRAKESIIRAIADLKVLDPAVGSGAFPMGILHKLILALQRLDPDNEHWQALQKERARTRVDTTFETGDQRERNAELLAISETFQRYSGDFGRKLYLIQNSIFGVDIQPVACQIARLRFFISLAIEQESDETAENLGIKPLPNLETRFVAANTLIGLTGELMLKNKKAQDLERELNKNREHHFHTTTRRQKLRIKRTDRKLRMELATELENLGLPADAAHKIANWDPYDQNDSAGWFDAEYMFGIADGFDVVIGNPPYIQLQKDGGKLGKFYKDAVYATFARTGDIYYLFYEKGVNLLKQGTGSVCFISSNQWMRVDSGKVLRKFIESQNPVRLVNLGAGVFDSVTVNTCVLLVNRSSNKNVLQAADVRQSTQQFPPTRWTNTRPANGETWIVLSETGLSVKGKMDTVGTPLKRWDVKINYGIKTGYNNAFIIDSATKDALIAEAPNSAEIIKPVLRGRDIQRYRAKWAGLYLITTFPSLQLDIDDYPSVKDHLLSFGKSRLEQSGKKLAGGGKSRKKTQHSWFEVQDTIAYHKDFAKEKIVWGNLCNQPKFSYAPKDMLVTAPCPFLTPFSHYLLAVLNGFVARRCRR